jgi:predicted restriction endonuclease
MHVEKQGVNTLIWNVTNTYKKLFEQDEWMSKRLIKLNYKNDSEDYIEALMNKYDELVLSKDKYFQKFQKRNPPDDGHPSLMAQKVIANSVINAMENRNSEGW